MEAEPKMLRVDVYDQLKLRMLTGELRAGQFVSQRELTELLGATLNPVRDAIRKLEAEGLIAVYAQRGIQIVEGKPKAINDAYDYRLLLETNAIRAFALNARPNQVGVLRKAVETSLESMERFPEDREVRIKALDDDYTFHRDLVDFQGNEVFSRHYRLNAARLRLFRVNIGEPLHRLDVAAREHLAILDACAERDPELAVARLVGHIEISREHSLGIRSMSWNGGDHRLAPRAAAPSRP